MQQKRSNFLSTNELSNFEYLFPIKPEYIIWPIYYNPWNLSLVIIVGVVIISGCSRSFSSSSGGSCCSSRGRSSCDRGRACLTFSISSQLFDPFQVVLHPGIQCTHISTLVQWYLTRYSPGVHPWGAAGTSFTIANHSYQHILAALHHGQGTTRVTLARVRSLSKGTNSSFWVTISHPSTRFIGRLDNFDRALLESTLSWLCWLSISRLISNSSSPARDGGHLPRVVLVLLLRQAGRLDVGRELDLFCQLQDSKIISVVLPVRPDVNFLNFYNLKKRTKYFALFNFLFIHLPPFISSITNTVLSNHHLQGVSAGLHQCLPLVQAVGGSDDVPLVDDGAATHEVTSLKLDWILEAFIESSKVDSPGTGPGRATCTWGWPPCRRQFLVKMVPWHTRKCW